MYIKHFLYTTWRYCQSQQSTTVTLVIGGILAGMRTIFISNFNINSCYPIARGRLAGILWPRSNFTNISSAITRGKLAGLKRPTFSKSTITWGRVAGLKRPMPTTFLTRRRLRYYSSEISSSFLCRWEEEWLVLRDQHPKLPSPLIVNNTCSVSHSIGAMNGFRVMHFRNWIIPVKQGAM